MTDASAEPRGAWPAHLRPGALRRARCSSHYDASISFPNLADDTVGDPVHGVRRPDIGSEWSPAANLHPYPRRPHRRHGPFGVRPGDVPADNGQRGGERP